MDLGGFGCVWVDLAGVLGGVWLGLAGFWLGSPFVYTHSFFFLASETLVKLLRVVANHHNFNRQTANTKAVVLFCSLTIRH